MKCLGRSQAGLTLVELMVAMVLSLALMAAVYMAYQVQHKTATEQDAVSLMQQDQRAAMELISRDLKTAGCNPKAADITVPAPVGIVHDSLTVSSMGLVMDIGGDTDGGPNGQVVNAGKYDEGEYVVYSFDKAAGRIMRNDHSARPGVVASNVTTFGWIYYYGDEHVYDPSTNASEVINAVKITINSTVIKNGVEVNRKLVRTVRLRNCDKGGV